MLTQSKGISALIWDGLISSWRHTSNFCHLPLRYAHVIYWMQCLLTYFIALLTFSHSTNRFTKLNDISALIWYGLISSWEHIFHLFNLLPPLRHAHAISAMSCDWHILSPGHFSLGLSSSWASISVHIHHRHIGRINLNASLETRRVRWKVFLEQIRTVSGHRLNSTTVSDVHRSKLLSKNSGASILSVIDQIRDDRRTDWNPNYACTKYKANFTKFDNWTPSFVSWYLVAK